MRHWHELKPLCNPSQILKKVALKNALGRVLSESIHSPINIPHDRNAAMDGYAFSSQGINPEQPFTLGLAGTSWAGRPF
jgi:molybdopterin molybdotransferase